MFSEASAARPALKLAEDSQLDFVTPRGDGTVQGQVTMVCYRGTGQSGCGSVDGNTLPGTWSRYTAPVSDTSDVGAGGLFNPAVLAGGVADGAWRVVGRTSLDGQQAIELRQTGRGGATAANLALLRVPIPAGYRQAAPPY